LPCGHAGGLGASHYLNDSRNQPGFPLIGAFDKMTMTRGTDAMRREWERLLPVMRQGGFVPGVDHQTP
jgi:hypothetical protein